MLATVRKKKVLHTCVVQHYNPNTPVYLYLLYHLIRLLVITVVPAQQQTAKICQKFILCYLTESYIYLRNLHHYYFCSISESVKQQNETFQLWK